MFSAISIRGTLYCAALFKHNIAVEVTTKLACVMDVVSGLALLIIGCLSISGVLPCNAIVGGFMIAAGCINLIAAPIVTKSNLKFIANYSY
jgi:hypothetical protein